jgi:ParB/RepB/Spo0J family partition protein
VTLPTFQSLPYEQISPPANPSRLEIDREALGALADDIAVNGLLQPLGVRGPMPDGRFEIAFGHRRYLAVGLLGWTRVDAKVFPAESDLYQTRASENHQRTALTPIEEAREIANFLSRNEPIAAVARRYRKSTVWVHERLALLHYPADIQELVHAGKLKLGVASALAQIDHEGYRKQVSGEAVRVGCTGATAELWLAHWKSEGARLASNFVAVEEIALRRSAFIYYVPCDLCAEPADFATTRAIRTCRTCTTALDELVARTAAEAAEAAPSASS